MGYRKRLEEKIVDSSSSSSSSSSCLSDALLFATMCIIGLPVDVYVEDGSVYSGIFYTASVDSDFGIVLKKAKLTKRGKSKTNVASGSVIETLVIFSADLVQVVAKGVSLPSNVVPRNIEGENDESAVGTVPSSECIGFEAKKSIKSGMDKRHHNHKRSPIENESRSACEVTTNGPGKGQEGRNNLASQNGNAMDVQKIVDGSNFIINVRQAGENGLLQLQDEQKANLHQEDNADVQSSSSSLDSISERVKPIEEDKSSSGQIGDVTLDPCQRSLASTNESVPPQSSESSKSTKEFKLNPGAKIFSPSFVKPISATPTAMPTVANMAYVPSNVPMITVAGTSQPDAGINPFAPRSYAPSKFVPYGNLTTGNSGSGPQFSQPIVGHMGSRAQPLRYGAQYQPVQATPMFVNPNSQVMVGRVGQLVYVQPVSQDLVQGLPTISPVPTRPVVATQPVQFPKHQGTVTGQPLPLCVPQPFIAGAQQPYVAPGHIPILQTPFPASRPIAVPGPNGFFGATFQ